MTATSKTARFPADFHWGYATASAQIEGSPTAGGKSPSIQDVWAANNKSRIVDGHGPEVGTGFYEKWRDDIALMKSFGVNSYRMSLAWTRIVPSGKKGGEVNKQGVAWYRDVLVALRDAGITPFVTLYHWDLPQSLHDDYGGWLDRKIIADFEYYARVCFEHLGDLVDNWFTMNEPNILAIHGYRTGEKAPGQSSNRDISPVGDSSVDHLTVGHHLLLSHATAVRLYRTKFRKGKISLVVNINWGEPIDDSAESQLAARKHFECWSGWFTDPVVFGDYPELLKVTAGDKLPVFTDDEKALVKGSTDTMAINHYTTYMIAKRDPPLDPVDLDQLEASFIPDIKAGFQDKDGNDIAPPTGLPWNRCVPWGFAKLLDFAWKRYQLPIYITENGVSCPNEHTMPIKDALHDEMRIDYMTRYNDVIAHKISEGIPIKSWLGWTLTDNWEWAEGNTARFGVCYIDYDHGLKRHPKDSAWAMKKYFEDRIDKSQAA